MIFCLVSGSSIGESLSTPLLKIIHQPTSSECSVEFYLIPPIIFRVERVQKIVLLIVVDSVDKCEDVCVFKEKSECIVVCFLPIHSGLQWTYQPGSHRKKARGVLDP